MFWSLDSTLVFVAVRVAHAFDAGHADGSSAFAGGRPRLHCVLWWPFAVEKARNGILHSMLYLLILQQ